MILSVFESVFCVVVELFGCCLRFWGVFGAWRAVPGAGRPPELIKHLEILKSSVRYLFI